MLAALTLAAGLVLAQPHTDRLTREQVEEDLRAFRAAAETNWSYHDLRTRHDGVDLDAGIAAALAAMPDGATRDEFRDALRILVASLHDGHASVSVPGASEPALRALPFEVRECLEGLIVTAVHGAGADPDVPRPGDRLVSIGGTPVEDLIVAAAPRVYGSTPGMRRADAIRRALSVPDGPAEIVTESPDGARRRWTVPAEVGGVPSRSRDPALDWPTEGVARLTIPRFSVPDWAGWLRAPVEERDKFLEEPRAALDAAVNAAIDGGARALLLDLRGNSGGTDLLGIHLAERLLPRPFIYFKLSARIDGAWTQPFGQTRHPRAPVFEGPIVVLADEAVFSTTDNFLRCLDDLHPDLTVVGRPTGAGTGAPTRQDPLPNSGAVVTFCAQRVYGPKGQLIEGSGTRPDVPITWTQRDIVEGRDPDLAAALAHLGVAAAQGRAPHVSYTVACDPGAADPRLAVRLHASGLDLLPGPIDLHLPDHGEWTDLDGLYLRGLHARPPLERSADQPNLWSLHAPPDWDGVLSVSYTIPLTPRASRLHDRQGLLPWCADGLAGAPKYAAILSENTLLRVRTPGVTPPIAADIVITGPSGATIASGWASPATGEQRAHLPAGLHDGPLLIGSPRTATLSRGGVVCEVAQFAGEADITAPVLETAHTLLAAYAATTGRPLDRPMRIFITDKGGGQWMPGGLLMQVARSAEEAASPHYRMLLAHELFHQWLGGYARQADPSLVWFQEGFTDYLALWHLAATGIITREQFIERLLELEAAARSSPACGTVAFGPAGPVWRDGNGANETLAYRGGAVLAFGLDAQLAARGGPRLAAMIGDLARDGDGTYTLAHIRAWLDAHGLPDFAQAFIDQPALPPLERTLAAIGFEPVATDLSYTGIAVAEGAAFGPIAAIDPDGPAAASGLRPGDIITGCWPCRPDPPRIGRDVRTPHAFGLDLFDPAAAEVNLGVRRDGEALTVKLRPTPRPGGFHWRPAADGSKAAAFFALPRPGTGSPE